MPQGVEHNKFDALKQFQAWVVFPLMPQGVEHLWLHPATCQRRVVFPLMPQGVEHLDANELSPRFDEWFFR